MRHLFRTLLIASVATFASSCTPYAARQAAQTVVEELQLAVVNRERAHEDFLRKVLVQHFAHLRGEAEAKWYRSRAELKLLVVEKVAAKEAEFATYTRSEIDQALGSRVEAMSKELDDAKQEFAAGLGGEDKKNELALQLAATMAHAQKAVADLDNETKNALASVRTAILAEIDAGMATVPGDWDASALAEASLAELKSQTDMEFLLAFDKGANELIRFIHLEAAPSLVLKGLVGDTLGSKVVTSLEKIATGKLGDLETKAREKVREFQTKFENRMTETTLSLLK
jgi:hypothetical protein